MEPLRHQPLPDQGTELSQLPYPQTPSNIGFVPPFQKYSMPFCTLSHHADASSSFHPVAVPSQAAPTYEPTDYAPLDTPESFAKGGGVASGNRNGWWSRLSRRTRYLIIGSVVLGLIIIIGAGAGIAARKSSSSDSAQGDDGGSGSNDGCHPDTGQYCADDFGCYGSVCFGNRCQC